MNLTVVPVGNEFNTKVSLVSLVKINKTKENQKLKKNTAKLII